MKKDLFEFEGSRFKDFNTNFDFTLDQEKFQRRDKYRRKAKDILQEQKPANNNFLQDNNFSKTNEPDIQNMLLPDEVNYYFSNEQEVSQKIQQRFQDEKEQLENVIDDFLKLVIQQSESAKQKLFGLIEAQEDQIQNQFQKFLQSVQEFLQESQSEIDDLSEFYQNQYNQLTTQNFSNFDIQMKKIQIERQRMADMESCFDKIRKQYFQSTINQDKQNLESVLKSGSAQNALFDKNIVFDNLKEISDTINKGFLNLHIKKQQFQQQNSFKSIQDRRPQSSNIGREVSANKYSRNDNILFQKNRSGNLALPTKIRENKFNLNQHSMNLLNRSKLQKNSGNTDSSYDQQKKWKNINNTQNNHQNFVNIYNQQKKLQTQNKNQGSRNSLLQQRPSSSLKKNPNNSIQDMNTSFTRNIFKPFSSIISFNKTNMISKSSLPLQKFTSKLLVDDTNNSITCFDFDINQSILICGFENKQIQTFFIQSDEIIDNQKLLIQAQPIQIKQFSSKYFIILTAALKDNLMLIKIDDLNEFIVYSTMSEKIIASNFFNSDKFLGITQNDKTFLYNHKSQKPFKTFKFSTKNIIDSQMPTSKTLFTVTKSGQIKIFNLNFSKDQISLTGSLKVDLEVQKMEIFHNNEKLLILIGQSNKKNQILIINVKAQKIMNILGNHQILKEIKAILTFTIVKKPPEIFLIDFEDNKISYCDIDDKKIVKEIQSNTGYFGGFKQRKNNQDSLIKIYSQEENELKLLALENEGITIIKFTIQLIQQFQIEFFYFFIYNVNNKNFQQMQQYKYQVTFTQRQQTKQAIYQTKKFIKFKTINQINSYKIMSNKRYTRIFYMLKLKDTQQLFLLKRFIIQIIQLDIRCYIKYRK